MSLSVNLPIYGRIPIGNTPGVGDVVGILIKTKNRLKAKSAPGLGQHDNYSQKLYAYDIIPASAKLQESYHYQAEVTQFPTEAGALVSDHVIVRPLRLELTFEVTNINGQTGNIYASYQDANDAWNQAKSRLESREPVQLLTAHTLLDNMVCVSIQADNTAPLWGKLAFRIAFQQVQQLALQTVKITEGKVISTDKTSNVNGQAVGSPNLSAVSSSDVTNNVPTAIDGTSASGITKSFMAEIY